MSFIQVSSSMPKLQLAKTAFTRYVLAVSPRDFSHRLTFGILMPAHKGSSGSYISRQQLYVSKEIDVTILLEPSIDVYSLLTQILEKVCNLFYFLIFHHVYLT